MRATSAGSTPLRSATVWQAMVTFAGSFRTVGSGPSTGESVSRRRRSSGRCLSNFCFCGERTTEGGIEK